MPQKPPATREPTDTPARGTRVSRIVSPRGVLRAAVVAGLFPVAGYFGRHHWALDLCNHPQAQYFCFLLLCTVVLAAWRKPKHALACLALLAIPALRLAPLYLPAPADEAAPRVRAAVYNVLGSNTRYAESAAWILRADPDFIYLPEANDEWAAGLAPLAAVYPHAADVFVEGNFGFAFRSKFPIVRQRTHRLGALEIPLLEAVLSTPHGELTVFGAHPVPPVTAFWAGERDTYLRALADLADGSHGRAVVLGDLNATRWSFPMEAFWWRGFRDSADGHGFSATWMRENPVMAVPIDHILSRGFSGVIRRETGPALGSDHRAVVADLAW